MGRGRRIERDDECGFLLRAQAHDPETMTRAEVKSQMLNRLNDPDALRALDYVVDPPNQPISVPIIFYVKFP